MILAWLDVKSSVTRRLNLPAQIGGNFRLVFGWLAFPPAYLFSKRVKRHTNKWACLLLGGEDDRFTNLNDINGSTYHDCLLKGRCRDIDEYRRLRGIGISFIATARQAEGGCSNYQ